MSLPPRQLPPVMEISEVATELAEEAVSVGVGIGAGGEGGVGVAGSRRVNWFGVGELNIQGDTSTHIYPSIYVSIFISIYTLCAGGLRV